MTTDRPPYDPTHPHHIIGALVTYSDGMNPIDEGEIVDRLDSGLVVAWRNGDVPTREYHSWDVVDDHITVTTDPMGTPIEPDDLLVPWLLAALTAPAADDYLKGECAPCRIQIMFHPKLGWSATAMYADGSGRLGSGQHLEVES